MVESTEKSQNFIRNDRYIGRVIGPKKGPTLIFFGGIHGNEPAGVKALEHIFEKLNSSIFEIKGAIYGIRGNIPALLQKKRFLQTDLNRLWTKEKIFEIKNKSNLDLNIEELELLKIEKTVLEILSSQHAPFYFVDFHTTSSKTIPFITINDAMINRKFSRLFPLPVILGIEEYIEGPLLSIINQMGYVSLGFESGQHNELSAVSNSISFLWLTLVFTEAIEKKEIPDFEAHYEQLSKSAEGDAKFYEVAYRHILTNTDDFAMLSGFESFQKVGKGTALAIQNKTMISVEKKAILFMPLYQQQGADGFFLIKNTPMWALKLSALLRKMRFDKFLVLLPGISWSNTKKESLLVNLSVVRFFAKSFFHLMGYRNRTIDKTHILMHNRELIAKNQMYQGEFWY